jgi:hypothetical protein
MRLAISVAAVILVSQAGLAEACPFWFGTEDSTCCCQQVAGSNVPGGQQLGVVVVPQPPPLPPGEDNVDPIRQVMGVPFRVVESLLPSDRYRNEDRFRRVVELPIQVVELPVRLLGRLFER